MTGPDHADLQRDMGRVEGKQDAMGARLDRLEKAVNDGFDKIDKRLAGLEAKENERKGAMALLMVLSGAIGGGLVKLVTFFMGAH